MKVLVVSGFLGAGKTTFIKELIKRTDKYPVILENEYGDNNLDSRSLKEEGGEIEILEFMEGCVCCTKKDSFVNTVLSISAAMDPEYLVIEPTGLGKLSVIIDSIKKIQYERIEILPSILVLNPQSYKQHLATYPEVFNDQLKSADTIVFSKVEGEDGDYLNKMADEIRSQNPQADIVAEHYTLQGDDWWNSLWEGAAGAGAGASGNSANGKTAGTAGNAGATGAPGNAGASGEAEAVGAPGSAETAAGGFAPVSEPQQLSLKDMRFENLAALIAFLEDIIHGEFGAIVRAKGVVPVGAFHLRFDVADNLYAIKEEDPQESQCVFIGNSINMNKVISRTSAMKDLPIEFDLKR